MILVKIYLNDNESIMLEAIYYTKSGVTLLLNI